MLVLDVKDFRQFSTFEIPLADEANFLTLLNAAGVDFEDGPLDVKVRIKDSDFRNLPSRFDLCDAQGLAFRINLYFPPLDECPNATYLAAANTRTLHGLKHLAQIRTGTDAPETYEEAMAKYHAWEAEADEFEKSDLSIFQKATADANSHI